MTCCQLVTTDLTGQCNLNVISRHINHYTDSLTPVITVQAVLLTYVQAISIGLVYFEVSGPPRAVFYCRTPVDDCTATDHIISYCEVLLHSVWTWMTMWQVDF